MLFHCVNLILDCWPDVLKFDTQPPPWGICLLLSQVHHEVRDVHFQHVSPAEKPQGGSVQDCGSNTIAPENTLYIVCNLLCRSTQQRSDLQCHSSLADSG